MYETNENIASSDTLNKPLFRDITAEDYDPEITEMESLCVNCEEQGVTRLFLTKIPFYKEVIVSSFCCDHCGNKNAELQSGGSIQDRGVSYKLNVTNIRDLNRQVVKTEYATIRIPSLDFEVAPGKSNLTTLEGVISQVIDGLEQQQVQRKVEHPDVAEKIEEFIGKLKDLKLVEKPFQFVLDDPSGNSFLENPYAPTKDAELTVSHYARTRQQDEFLGLLEQEEEPVEDSEGKTVGQDDGEGFNTQNEVLSFSTNCPNCRSPCDTHMKLVNIPHFKEVVIMATTCSKCGHRDNEVKSSGGIEELGQKIDLVINTPEDMARDVLKSELSTLSIPDLDFEMEMGTLGGKFTTVEGLLLDVKTQLKDFNPFFRGDSSQPQMCEQLSDFCEKIDEIVQGKRTGVHFVLDDASGNSYIQSLCAPDPDPQLTITRYTRTWEQNEELGLNDMKTENYEQA
ncbi:zinc finger protein ZPR1-like [Physella acuta]|uniref:zinc finger protein ZPR1-like n=1 Tax=Physella acuta TaxID=109671 RepID=UPI0027DC91A3|nr:zinc finger protein ZPR1-like [Physella acuta]